MLGEDNVPVLLNHLHRDSMSLGSAIHHTAVIRVADKHLWELFMQVGQEEPTTLKLCASGIEIRIGVVETQRVVVKLIPEINYEVWSEGSLNFA
jgi:hypothetical protein